MLRPSTSATAAAQLAEPPAPHQPQRLQHSRLRALWSAATSGIGAVVGLAPHVLHHVGPLVGTAVVAGTGGTVLFGALGVLAAIPMLIRMRRRSSSHWPPVIALALFLVAFAFSTFVLGPLISGEESVSPATDIHDGHHLDDA